MKKVAPLIAVLAIFGLFMLVRMGMDRQSAMHGDGTLEKFSSQFRTFEAYSTPVAMPSASFMGPDGKEHTFDDYRGSYLLVNFWATWCPPCLNELPSLQDLHDKFKGTGLKVIAISLDSGTDIEGLKSFLVNRRIGSVALYHDNRKYVQKALLPEALPTTYLLDPQGDMIFKAGGDADWTSFATLDYLRAKLNSMYSGG